jgi:hypothetical protein
VIHQVLLERVFVLWASRLEYKHNPIATADRERRDMVGRMKTDTEEIRLGAQEALDELFKERLIPFTLSARVVESLGLAEYIVHFHDSWLRAVDVSWLDGQSFKASVRRAVLDRVSRLSGPLRNKFAVASH